MDVRARLLALITQEAQTELFAEIVHCEGWASQGDAEADREAFSLLGLLGALITAFDPGSLAIEALRDALLAILLTAGDRAESVSASDGASLRDDALWRKAVALVITAADIVPALLNEEDDSEDFSAALADTKAGRAEVLSDSERGADDAAQLLLGGEVTRALVDLRRSCGAAASCVASHEWRALRPVLKASVVAQLDRLVSGTELGLTCGCPNAIKMSRRQQRKRQKEKERERERQEAEAAEADAVLVPCSEDEEMPPADADADAGAGAAAHRNGNGNGNGSSSNVAAPAAAVPLPPPIRPRLVPRPAVRKRPAVRPVMPPNQPPTALALPDVLWQYVARFMWPKEIARVSASSTWLKHDMWKTRWAQQWWRERSLRITSWALPRDCTHEHDWREGFYKRMRDILYRGKELFCNHCWCHAGFATERALLRHKEKHHGKAGPLPPGLVVYQRLPSEQEQEQEGGSESGSGSDGDDDEEGEAGARRKGRRSGKGKATAAGSKGQRTGKREVKTASGGMISAADAKAESDAGFPVFPRLDPVPPPPPTVYVAKPKLYPIPAPDENGRYPCAFCADKEGNPLSYKSPRLFMEHLHGRHGPRCYECPACGLRFPAVRHLRQHYWRHVGGRKIPCDVCGKTFRRPSALTKHKDTAHYGVGVRCPYKCDYVFHTQERYDRHMQLAHPEGKYYFCSDMGFNCNSTFTDRLHFVNHLRLDHRFSLGPRGKVHADPREPRNEEETQNVKKAVGWRKRRQGRAKKDEDSSSSEAEEEGKSAQGKARAKPKGQARVKGKRRSDVSSSASSSPSSSSLSSASSCSSSSEVEADGEKGVARRNGHTPKTTSGGKSGLPGRKRKRKRDSSSSSTETEAQAQAEAKAEKELSVPAAAAARVKKRPRKDAAKRPAEATAVAVQAPEVIVISDED